LLKNKKNQRGEIMPEFESDFPLHVRRYRANAGGLEKAIIEAEADLPYDLAYIKSRCKVWA
jgi:hypothetical protein